MYNTLKNQKYLVIQLEDVLIENYKAWLYNNVDLPLGLDQPSYTFTPGVLQSLRDKVIDGYKIMFVSEMTDINNGKIMPIRFVNLLQSVKYNLGIFCANQSEYKNVPSLTAKEIYGEHDFIADSLESSNMFQESKLFGEWMEDKEIQPRDIEFVGNRRILEIPNTLEIDNPKFTHICNFVSSTPSMSKFIDDTPIQNK